MKINKKNILKKEKKWKVTLLFITTLVYQPVLAGPLEDLGREIFFDTNLSEPSGQSCATCHLPDTGFAHPNSDNPTSEGPIEGVFSHRNAPTISYTQFIPRLRNSRFGVRGGLFIDGRVSSLEEQAKVPFLNPSEMNNESEATVIERISEASYADQFRDFFGEDSLFDTERAFDQVASAIAAFERSEEVSPFSSKFDAIIQNNERPTSAEIRGFRLFTGRAGCISCHSFNREPRIFTDFTYHNIGVPANPNNPFYAMDFEINPEGSDFIDLGLGETTGRRRNNGQFRVPTLRNVSLTAPYMHNGVFDTLEEVLEFYNTRDLDPEQFPAEVRRNVTNRGGIGNLGLSDRQMQDIIAFLGGLSDRP
jgi:cytochrome c peroxidase